MNTFLPYTHTVQYYETDKMGITHHSNYIRWMEEARVDFLAQMGWDYAKLESLGIVSPVTAVDCKYMISTTFAEKITITVSIAEFKGVRLKLAYTMKNTEGKVVCQAHSEHCFLDTSGNLIRLKKDFPEFYEALCGYAGSAPA
ncbi:MAG TPA: acyl-CoA thioesterase [Candidatus Blautia intestinipullorum]|mgnify:FL=1|nr:acyl-CoA thioesterase [Candidatus Blautia intestinipullorum]